MLVELGDVGRAGLLHHTVSRGGGPAQEPVPDRGAAVTSAPTSLTNSLAVVGDVATALEVFQAVSLVAEDVKILSSYYLHRAAVLIVNLNFT